SRASGASRSRRRWSPPVGRLVRCAARSLVSRWPPARSPPHASASAPTSRGDSRTPPAGSAAAAGATRGGAAPAESGCSERARSEETPMSIYADQMTDSQQADGQRDDVTEQLRAETARAVRDRALSMSERLERVHQLCAQLARLEPVRPKRQR